MAKGNSEKLQETESMTNVFSYVEKNPIKDSYKYAIVKRSFNPHTLKTEVEWKEAINKLLTEEFK